MVRLAEQTAAVVLFHSGDAKASVKLHRGDAATSGVLHGDPTHGTAAPAVEAAKPGEEILTEAPHPTTADPMRLYTSASGLCVVCTIDPKYLRTFVKPTKPRPSPPGPGTVKGVGAEHDKDTLPGCERTFIFTPQRRKLARNQRNKSPYLDLPTASAPA